MISLKFLPWKAIDKKGKKQNTDWGKIFIIHIGQKPYLEYIHKLLKLNQSKFLKISKNLSILLTIYNNTMTNTQENIFNMSSDEGNAN